MIVELRLKDNADVNAPNTAQSTKAQPCTISVLASLIHSSSAWLSASTQHAPVHGARLQAHEFIDTDTLDNLY